MALRLLIGFHFFHEGISKLRDGTPFSGPFFANAKGRLAPLYQGMVWDEDGRARLNYAVDAEGRPVVDVELTLIRWDQYRAQVIKRYGFDDAQRKRAGDILRRYERQLRWFFEVHGEDMITYFRGLQRRDNQRQQSERREVASLRYQSLQWESELKKQRAPWLAGIATMWAGYERELNALATPQQRESTSAPNLVRPGRQPLDSETIDQIIPYFDMAIGILLVAGLFTRLASLTGAAFLASVVVSQWPGAVGAMPTWYQGVEMLSLLVLAAVGAGRFAGLDYVVQSLWKSCCSPKQGTDV